MKFTCDFCEGTVRTELARREYRWGDQLIATFVGVPCGICDRCGEHYFDSDVAREMDLLAQPLVLQLDDGPSTDAPLIDYSAHRHALQAASAHTA